MDFKTLEKKYAHGVALLKQYGYYEQVLEEIHLLVKYFDTNYFLQLLTENIFDDIKGTFRSFVQKELKTVYEELHENPTLTLSPFLEREFNSLTILLSCSLNVKYQVSGLMRYEQTRRLPFKSSLLQAIHRKLNGEIQEYYKELSDNYKKYFRRQFSAPMNANSHVSIHCIRELQRSFEECFIDQMQKFYILSEALQFVHDYFIMELRVSIEERVSVIFQARRDRLQRIMTYFIEDLKRNFIRVLDRQLRRGKSFKWIQKAFLLFLDSPRFEELMRRVIYQSLSALQYRSEPSNARTDA